jgi:hypothetical protein
LDETLRVGQQPSVIVISTDHALWVMGNIILVKIGPGHISYLATAMYVNEGYVLVVKS